MSLKSQIARKPHRCDECGRLIPVGARYWRDFDDMMKDERQHTNCLDFADQRQLPAGFNQNRTAVPTTTRK